MSRTPFSLGDSGVLQQILEAIEHPAHIIQADNYSLVMANRAAKANGTPKARTCYELTHRRTSPCEGRSHPCPVHEVLQNGAAYTTLHTHFRADGSPYRARVIATPIFNAEGEITHTLERSVDITSFEALEQGQHLIALLEKAVAFSGNAVVITDANGIIEYVNPAFTQITGYTAEEAIGQKTSMLKSGQHSEAFYRDLWQSILRGEVWRGEMTNRKKNGEIYWEYMTIAPLRDESGAITHFVAIKEDITRRKLAELKLEHLAATDPLTGIPNRRHFFQHGEWIFTTSSGALTALMLDLDHFKRVNDQHGHAAGDYVLHETARRLHHNLRPGDLLARYGGEEFCALLPRTDRQAAQKVAERLRAAIAEQPFSLLHTQFFLTISIGAAIADEHDASLEALLEHADQALYHAKRAGRNRVIFFSDVPAPDEGDKALPDTPSPPR